MSLDEENLKEKQQHVRKPVPLQPSAQLMWGIFG
jgi:hypothetical protein